MIDIEKAIGEAALEVIEQGEPLLGKPERTVAPIESSLKPGVFFITEADWR